jgi:hypothetical protein
MSASSTAPIRSLGNNATVRGRDLAAQQVAGGESPRTPLVLEFVVGVLHVRPLPVEMGDGQQVFLEAGYQHDIFIDEPADHFDAPVRQQGKAG